MEPVTLAALKTFLRRLGERYPNPAEFYLLGGSALLGPLVQNCYLFSS